MATRKATKLALVQPDLDQMEAAVTEAAQQTAPITSRAAQAANENAARLATLARERDDFLDRVKLLDAQYEAAKAGLAMHIADIEAAMTFYPQRAAE